MKKLLLSLCITLWSIGLYAQNFSGEAIYSTSSTMSVSFGSPEKGDSLQSPSQKTSMSITQQEDINKKIRAAMQKEYELLFDSHSSLYKEIPKVKDFREEKGVEVVGLGGGTEGGLYKNNRDASYAESRDIFGKVFLVQDSLIQWDWNLEKESKKIGDYTCYRATTTKKSKPKTSIKGEAQKEIKERKIEAWYTPEIPISQGPGEYWGLPGFILEVEDEKLHIICSKITIDKEERKIIEAPTKGKKVDRQTFKEIYEEKVQEMKKMYADKRKKN